MAGSASQEVSGPVSLTSHSNLPPPYDINRGPFSTPIRGLVSMPVDSELVLKAGDFHVTRAGCHHPVRRTRTGCLCVISQAIAPM